MAILVDLWYIHREAVLRAVGICLLIAAAAWVAFGTSSDPSGALGGTLFRNFALPIIAAALVTFLVRRWYWYEEDASWRELTPEGLAAAGALSVCMALAFGGPNPTPVAVPGTDAAPPFGVTESAAVTAGGATERLTTPGFSASYPSGWRQERSDLPKGMTRWALSSGGSAVNRVGIANPGELALSVYVFPLASVDHPPKDLSNPYEVLSAVVGVPDDAINTQPTSPKSITLGGQPAASMAFAYDYHGTSIIQNDVVAIRGDQVFFIELNRVSALASEGTTAMHDFLESWQWSRPVVTASS